MSPRSPERRVLAVSNARLLRPRLLDWLRANSGSRVRLVCGSPGTGKSALLEDFALATPGALVLTVAPSEPAASFCERLAQILGLDTDFASNLERLHQASAQRNALLVIDDADAGSEQLTDFLSGLFEQRAGELRFVISARTRDTFKNPRLLVDGTVARLPAAALNFTVAEIAQYCDQRNISYTSKDLSKAHALTGGWAIATAACIRYAGATGCSLNECMTHWRNEQAHALSEYVRHELRNRNAENTMLRVLSPDGGQVDPGDLSTLERDGLFVEYVDGRFSVMQPVRDFLGTHAARGLLEARIERPVMHVSVLGEFIVSISERRVAFMRRRDAQIFKYVLLKPTGRASRSELLDAFWPNHERQSALQGLRTACSNIRQALRDATNQDDATGYFTADGDLAVPRERVVLDVDRLAALVASGDVCLASGEIRSAITNYESARALYHGALIVDVAGCHYAHLAQDADSMFEHAREQLQVLVPSGSRLAGGNVVFQNKRIAQA
ncbi:MAG: AAA family ATPase [Candidatus Baltobacteraceae bacterium]